VTCSYPLDHHPYILDSFCYRRKNIRNVIAELLSIGIVPILNENDAVINPMCLSTMKCLDGMMNAFSRWRRIRAANSLTTPSLIMTLSQR
jgi:hypothetical protein